ncbi:mechanosensitive ion channel [Lutimonas halocynthiae]|nr:mechanosensitive ion channel domain-containing protein [Lutimonas halocynthiae]MDN3644555.1 mechanosensitive ion channel [Lutimonas halocynthiae]
MDMNNLLDEFNNIIYTYGPKLLGAIAVLIIGNYIIKIMLNSFSKMLDKKKTDSSLKPFLLSLVRILLKTMLVISVLGMLGVQMTSFIAVLGAAGLAVGMALSGTLQNFAGGVIILLFKPFKVGDYINAQGHSGIVKEIQIFNTILLELDNKTVIIPNGPLSTGSMVNYSTEPTRRVDFTFGIAYGDSVDKARKILFQLFKEDKRILTDPASFVGLSEMADSSVNLTARAWVKGEDYWDVFFDINEKTYNAFNAEGISIPFPQMDVHLQK